MRKYSCLSKQLFSSGRYAIVPIRDQDKFDIMQWRNEQIYHLRQAELLTAQQQEWYFSNVIAKLFDELQPSQILFSYLEDNICIGYGGLVHINWIDKNAEISFIMDTSLEKDFFAFHWQTYLSLIEQVAFDDLNLHKIYTYAFNLRPHLYEAIEKINYHQEARLPGHCLFQGKFIDVLIHSKFNPINIREASETDLRLYFEWANDAEVRKHSFNSEVILLEQHQKWFQKKVIDRNCLMLIFENSEQIPLGQVRFENDETQKISIIGVSIDKHFRGQKLSGKILEMASTYFLKKYSDYTIYAYIKSDNQGSISAFKKAGFVFSQNLDYQGTQTILYTRHLQ